MKVGLFGSSGIRGLVNVDLTLGLAVKVGLAVGTFIGAEKVFVARDTRVSGIMLENAVVSGLMACGAEVQRLGVLPTPVLAYLTRSVGADAGLMITASHNPPQYNGIKVFDSEGLAYDEEKQSQIESIIKEEKFDLADWRNLGKEVIGEIDSQVYLEMMQENVQLKRKWKIVIDPGCGATSLIAPAIFKNLGCKVVPINAQYDGYFPGRSPEPNADSLKSLARIVKEFGADLGVAYDGDGDRVAFIDENGTFVDFDRILAAYAAHMLEEAGGDIAVTTVEASMSFDRMVESRGGKVVRTKVGDVYVAKAVKEFGAVFGGEPCGAWIHPQLHYCPDGILSSALLLKALEDENKSLSEFVSRVPAYAVARKSIPCKDRIKYETVMRVKELLEENFPDYRQLSTVDGVLMKLKDCWILVRASGTEPLVRITVESESSKAANEIMEKVSVIVNKAVEDLEK